MIYIVKYNDRVNFRIMYLLNDLKFITRKK